MTNDSAHATYQGNVLLPGKGHMWWPGFCPKLTAFHADFEIDLVNRHGGGHANRKLTADLLARYDQVWFFDVAPSVDELVDLGPRLTRGVPTSGSRGPTTSSAPTTATSHRSGGSSLTRRGTTTSTSTSRGFRRAAPCATRSATTTRIWPGGSRRPARGPRCAAGSGGSSWSIRRSRNIARHSIAWMRRAARPGRAGPRRNPLSGRGSPGGASPNGGRGRRRPTQLITKGAQSCP
jgi:hypothetical protein